MNNEEYCSIIQILKSRVDATKKYGIPALMNHFHLIATIDDTTQRQTGNLKKQDYFYFCLKIRLNWSKYVTDVRNAPWQAIIGCFDTTFCVILSTSLWLEFFQTNANAQLSTYFLVSQQTIQYQMEEKKSKNMVQRVYW